MAPFFITKISDFRDTVQATFIRENFQYLSPAEQVSTIVSADRLPEQLRKQVFRAIRPLATDPKVKFTLDIFEND